MAAEPVQQQVHQHLADHDRAEHRQRAALPVREHGACRRDADGRQHGERPVRCAAAAHHVRRDREYRVHCRQRGAAQQAHHSALRRESGGHAGRLRGSLRAPQ
jgi:hypothetical protein